MTRATTRPPTAAKATHPTCEPTPQRRRRGRPRTRQATLAPVDEHRFLDMSDRFETEDVDGTAESGPELLDLAFDDVSEADRYGYLPLQADGLMRHLRAIRRRSD